MGTNFYLMSKSKKLMREYFAVEKDYGFTDEEYRDWLIYGNDVVRDILYCRRHSINYHDYINMSSGDKIAARSYNLEEVKKYKKDGE